MASPQRFLVAGLACLFLLSAGRSAVAQDCGGRPTTPETRTFDKDPDIEARVRAFMAEHLPTALGPEIRTRTCLYTLTPDRDFVAERFNCTARCTGIRLQ